jgi:hypothetical protein
MNQLNFKPLIMMKKTLRYLVVLTAIILIAVSCSKLTNTYDKALLTGKWKSGTLYYKYAADGTGGSWDTGQNVTEAEAKPFTWTLDNDLLTQIFTGQIGGIVVPKSYTVTELTATSLKYHDDFGGNFSFTKAK